MNPLAKLSQATTALAEARTLPEITKIRDLAEAARTYAKAAQLGLEAQNHAAEIKLRAERKAGEVLKKAKENGEVNGKGRPEKISHDAILKVSDLGISKDQSSRYQAVASLPEEVFEAHIEETISEGKELTTASVLRVAKDVERHDKQEQMAQAPTLTGKYRVFYADPPWKYNDSGVIGETDNYGRAERHYPTLSIAELCALPIKEMADDDAVLFLWVTSPLLEDSFQVIKAWGFQYKSSFVWDKVKHNFAHYNSMRHEFLLVCTRGSCTPDVKQLFDSVVSVERSGKHSEKPEAFRTIIDTIYPFGRRIELFARAEYPNWETWGNDIR